MGKSGLGVWLLVVALCCGVGRGASVGLSQAAMGRSVQSLSRSVQSVGRSVPSVGAVRGCAAWLLEMATRPLVPTRVPSQIARHIGKALFYPLAASVNFSKVFLDSVLKQKGVSSLAVRLKAQMQADLFHLVAFIGLSVGANSFSITDTQIERGMSPIAPNSVVVVINGFESGTDLWQSTQNHFQRLSRQTNRAQYVEASSWRQLSEQLTDIRQESGQIARIDIFAHGAPGMIVLLDENVRSETLHGSAWGGDYLNEHDVCAPNAEIVLFSCQSGRGPSGDALLEELSRVLTHGGTITSSRVDTHPDLVEIVSANYFHALTDVGSWVNTIANETAAIVRLGIAVYPRTDSADPAAAWPWRRIVKLRVDDEL